jgi:hypothetical protein
MPRIGSVPPLTRALFCLSLSLGALPGCCLTPPTAEELLDLGFRSPEQAFHTMRAAVRGDLPRLEYRCLSAGFRQRNHLSQLSYREFREDWYASNPWIRTALSRAQLLQCENHSDGRRATLTVGSLGQEIQVTLVAEDFVQVWDGAELREDIALDNMRPHMSLHEGAWTARFPGGSPPPTELRLGRDWKIDSISQTHAAP